MASHRRNREGSPAWSLSPWSSVRRWSTSSSNLMARWSSTPAAAPANVAVALSRLERPVLFATAFADDRYGEILRQHLDAAGVGLAGDPNSIDHTSSAIATIGEDGSASYVFDIEWRLGDTYSAAASPVAIHTSSLAAVLLPGCEDVVRTADRTREGAVISYDINARPSITGTGARGGCGGRTRSRVADIVKASDEDLEALYPDRSIAESAQALQALGPWPSS